MRRIVTAVFALALVATAGCGGYARFPQPASLDWQAGLTKSSIEIAVPTFKAGVFLDLQSWNLILKAFGLPEIPEPTE